MLEDPASVGRVKSRGVSKAAFTHLKGLKKTRSNYSIRSAQTGVEIKGTKVSVWSN